MESLIGLAVLVIIVTVIIVISLVSGSPQDDESKSQKQDPFPVDTLFHVDITLDVISEVIESAFKAGTAIVEGIGSVLEVSVDVLDW